MIELQPRILYINTADIYGGAAKIAYQQFQANRKRGDALGLLVGQKAGNDPGVFVLPNDDLRKNWWTRIWLTIGNLFSPLVAKKLWALPVRHRLHLLGQPQRLRDILRGHEDFNFPATWKIFDLIPERPDLIHCHNLHSNYFDLRALPWLSHQAPVLLTLHDAWLLSGHCAHSFDCERWKIGCGQCPDLSIYPSIQRDATVYNWRRKQEIFAKSRVYVATPSRWLLEKVEQSILAPAIIEARVIPNGVDLSVFHPGDQQAARIALGIPQDKSVLLFTASGIQKNAWKDYLTMRTAVTQIAERLPEHKILFLALGEDAPPGKIGQADLRFIPFQKNPRTVALCYQAADVYIHAARAEVWGLTITEAMACGKPVVCTTVGGIPEQVKGLQMEGPSLGTYKAEEATGMLIPRANAESMTNAVVSLLTHDQLRKQLGYNAGLDCKQRFSLEHHLEAYFNWYHKILKDNYIS